MVTLSCFTDMEELWSGITYNPTKEELIWEPLCPIKASVSLCHADGQNSCRDLGDVFYSHGQKVCSFLIHCSLFLHLYSCLFIVNNPVIISYFFFDLRWYSRLWIHTLCFARRLSISYYSPLNFYFSVHPKMNILSLCTILSLICCPWGMLSQIANDFYMHSLPLRLKCFQIIDTQNFVKFGLCLHFCMKKVQTCICFHSLWRKKS